MQLSVRTVSPLEKIFPDEAPAASAAPRFSGFQNESVSFQLALKPAGLPAVRGFVRLRVDCELPLRIRRVLSVPALYAAAPAHDADVLRDAKPGLYPDLLRDTRDGVFRVVEGQWQGLWIEAANREPARPGRYPVRFAFLDARDGDREVGSAESEIEILPGFLPESRLIYTRWLHCDCIANYYGVEMWSEPFWKILKNFVAVAASRGINAILTPIHTPPLDTEIGGERLSCQLVDVTLRGGRYAFGFEKLRRWVELCRGLGIRYFEMAHLFTQWGAKHAPKIIATENGAQKRIFGWETDATGAEYANFLSQYLPALIREIDELGVRERCFFHISDEPGRAQLNDYLAAKALVEPYLRGFPIRDALSDFDFYTSGAVKTPIPANDHIRPFLDAKVKGLWTYYCVAQGRGVSNQFLSMPSRRNRALGAQLFRYDIEGFLHWGYNFYSGENSLYPVDPYAVTDADGALPAGDAFQVYPGPGGAPEESLRILITEQALNDLRALRLLEALKGREYALRILREAWGGEVEFSRCPDSDDVLIRLRERVNREILAAGCEEKRAAALNNGEAVE